MKITRRSPITGKINTRDIPITPDQYDRWRNGEYIQVVMPELTPAQREFLISGATEDDWNELFPEEIYDDEDDYYFLSFVNPK